MKRLRHSRSPLAALRRWAGPLGCRCRWNRPCRSSSCSGCFPGGGLLTAERRSWRRRKTLIVDTFAIFWATSLLSYWACFTRNEKSFCAQRFLTGSPCRVTSCHICAAFLMKYWSSNTLWSRKKTNRMFYLSVESCAFLRFDKSFLTDACFLTDFKIKRIDLRDSIHPQTLPRFKGIV